MQSSPDPEDAATVHFAPDEAVVLLNMLSRWTERDAAGDTPSRTCFESTAEMSVLNDLLCDLEKQLVAPFKEDFGRILEEARNRLADRWCYPTLRG